MGSVEHEERMANTDHKRRDCTKTGTCSYLIASMTLG